MDTISKQHRSWNMSRIKADNTAPELLVRSYLFRHGLRFRVHDSKLPGKPDIVLKKYCSAVFVNGCFWHRHKGCHRCTTPTTNVEYWAEKFKRNTERDKKNFLLLNELGWRVFVIWECQIKNEKTLIQLYQEITSGRPLS